MVLQIQNCRIHVYAEISNRCLLITPLQIALRLFQRISILRVEQCKLYGKKEPYFYATWNKKVVFLHGLNYSNINGMLQNEMLSRRKMKQITITRVVFIPFSTFSCQSYDLFIESEVLKKWFNCRSSLLIKSLLLFLSNSSQLLVIVDR